MDSPTLHVRMTEDDPEEVLERMEALVAEAAEERGEGTPITEVAPVAREHRETVRDGAE